MSAERLDRSVAINLGRLIRKLRYLELLDERRGPTVGRANEYRALTWAVEELSAVYPAEYEDAEAFVAANPVTIAEDR